jgi:hypothetical protein
MIYSKHFETILMAVVCYVDFTSPTSFEMETSSEESLENLPKIEEEIPELKVENPCVVEKEVKEVIAAEEIQLIYKPPRFFRRSIFSKTIKSFGEKELSKKSKVKRPLRIR